MWVAKKLKIGGIVALAPWIRPVCHSTSHVNCSKVARLSPDADRVTAIDYAPVNIRR